MTNNCPKCSKLMRYRYYEIRKNQATPFGKADMFYVCDDCNIMMLDTAKIQRRL